MLVFLMSCYCFGQRVNTCGQAQAVGSWPICNTSKAHLYPLEQLKNNIFLKHVTLYSQKTLSGEQCSRLLFVSSCLRAALQSFAQRSCQVTSVEFGEKKEFSVKLKHSPSASVCVSSAASYVGLFRLASAWFILRDTFATLSVRISQDEISQRLIECL